VDFLERSRSALVEDITRQRAGRDDLAELLRKAPTPA
jgi:hypothetical protein